MGSISSRLRCQQRTSSDANDTLEDLPPLEEVPEDSAYVFASCSICFEQVRSCVLGCGHTVCQECIQSQLRARWPGDRITFGYLNCGICRARLAHESITQQLQGHWNFEGKVAEVSLRGARENGLLNALYRESCDPVTAESERQYAAERMVVHQCSECQEPYCAGVAECARLIDAQESRAKPRCPSCIWKASSGSDNRKCKIHGPEFAIYKCDFCCTLAVWECGEQHFCEPCHSGQPREHFCCSGPEDCPLGISHPPNGPSCKGFVFGCSACAGCHEPNMVYADSDYGYDHYDVEILEEDYLSFDDDCEQHRLLRDCKRATSKSKKRRHDEHLAHKKERSHYNIREAKFLTKRQRKYKAFLLQRNSNDFCIV